MKKFCTIIISIICLMLIANKIVYGQYMNDEKKNKLQIAVSSKLIRFHILANSDSDEDQKLKLKIKDEVLKMISPELEKCKSIEESRNVLKKNDAKIKALAEKVIKKNGYNYTVTTKLSHENFPVKSYGAITLPQGDYEAYRILIGNAEGHNWWCVMFPPLCFIDVSKGEVSDKQTSEKMKQVLNEDEFEYVSSNNDENKIQLKFRVVDWFKKII